MYFEWLARFQRSLTHIDSKPSSDLKIDWQVASDSTWAYNCDFNGKDFLNTKVPAEQCGPTCQDNPQCTHFTWTNYLEGTCWMKAGKVYKEQASVKDDGEKAVCGVLNKGNRLAVVVGVW